jgi:phage shock protein PspC (stress-responsive transcriptional regulator)
MTSTPPPTGPALEPEAPPAYPGDHPGDHSGDYRASYGRPGAPRVSADEVRDLGRLRRIVAHRKVAGVAGGIARHVDIDPLVVRVAFVVLSRFGRAGLIVYAACWILLPEDGQQSAPLGLDERSRSVALVLVAILGLALLVGQWDWFWVPGPLILVALVVWLVMSRRNEVAAAPLAPAPGVPHAGPDAVTPEQRWATPVTPVAPVAAEQPVAYAAPSYATTSSAPTAPPPPPTYATNYVRPEPRNPRKRGPKLFWFTMALATLAVGVVGTVDVSGAPVPGSTYPAVVTGVIGAMLLVGAFWGRAGGLILIGLLSATATGAAVAAEKVDTESTTVTPTSASGVLPSYDFSAGQYILDLSELADPEQLDGRTITVTGDLGELVVVTPDDMDVTVDAKIDGPGGYTLFGQESGGIDTTYSRSFDGGADVPEVALDLKLDLGHIEVRTEHHREN